MKVTITHEIECPISPQDMTKIVEVFNSKCFSLFGKKDSYFDASGNPKNMILKIDVEL